MRRHPPTGSLPPMRQRLMLGPVLIAVLLLVAWLDQRLEGAPVAEALRPIFLGRATVPPGLLIFFLAAALCFLAVRELATIMLAKGLPASKRIMTSAALLGLLVSCIVPSATPGHVGGLLV